MRTSDMASLTLLAFAAASVVCVLAPQALHECWLCHEKTETRPVTTSDMGVVHICLQCGEE